MTMRMDYENHVRDPDGDGMDNLTEHDRGTDPLAFESDPKSHRPRSVCESPWQR